MKIKELFCTKDGFKAWPNLFVWLGSAIVLGVIVNAIF